MKANGMTNVPMCLFDLLLITPHINNSDPAAQI